MSTLPGPVPLIFMGGWAHGGNANDSTMIPSGFRELQEEQEAQAERLAAIWMAQSGLADRASGSEEFAAIRERAKAIADLQTTTPTPPSLRKRSR